MKIILHIGMPKTGSTALQRTLLRNRNVLAASGVLYPASEHPDRRQHNFLAALTTKDVSIPRDLMAKYGNSSAVRAAFWEYWSEIDQQIQSANPNYVVLSGEGLFQNPSEEGAARLRTLLERYTNDILVFAYVRSPSSFYLSIRQQVLKSWHLIGVNHIEYRATLEQFQTGVAAQMVVAKYDRRDFYRGDIFQDFVERTMPEKSSSFAHILSQDINPSISAEGMAILQNYRGKFHPDRRGLTDDTNRLIEAIAAAEETVAGDRRPRLHEALREHIDAISVDVLWLRVRHSIIFDGVDYAAGASALESGLSNR